MPITKIEYHFGDSSVPPPHHRSYTIVVEPGSIRAVVDSYGDVVGEREGPLEPGAFENLVASLKKHEIRKCKSVRKDQGCSGGTSESVTCWEGDQESFSASVYHCGGDDYGSLCGNVRALAAEIRALVPGFRELMSL